MLPGALCAVTPGMARRISCVSWAPRASMVARSTTVTEAGVSRGLNPRRLPGSTGGSRLRRPLGGGGGQRREGRACQQAGVQRGQGERRGLGAQGGHTGGGGGTDHENSL